MNKVYRIFLSTLFLLAVSCLFVSTKSFADTPGDHPHYLNALAELRDARAHLDKLSDPREIKAMDEIDKAMDYIKKASIDDGKDLNTHAAVDLTLDKKGLFKKALGFLNGAKSDVGKEDEDKAQSGLKGHVLYHINKAISLVKKHIKHLK